MQKPNLPNEVKKTLTAILEGARSPDEQGSPDAAVESPQARKQRIRGLIQEQLSEVNAKCAVGIQALRDRDETKQVNVFLKRVDKALKKQDWPALVTACTNEDFDKLQSVALDTMQQTHLDDAEAIYTFLMCLRPMAPQSYVGLISVLWKREGPKRAAEAYAAVLPRMQSPALNFFAADCFVHAERQQDDQDALISGLEIYGDRELEDEDDITLRGEMQKYLEELKGSGG